MHNRIKNRYNLGIWEGRSQSDNAVHPHRNWASQVVLVVKNLPANVEDIRDAGSIPGSGSPGGGHGNSLQYSCLENPMDRGAWWATVDRVAESETTKVAQHAHRNYAVFLFLFWYCNCYYSQKIFEKFLTLIVFHTKNINVKLGLTQVFICPFQSISSVGQLTNSLPPHEPQHTRPPCPSPTPRVHPNPCPSSQWCHPTNSSSVVPFSSCLQSFPTMPAAKLLQSCPTVRPHRWQPTRLCRPWDSPGKNTGVSCHFLLHS